MSAQYWPHLNQTGGVLPHVRTDFGRWAWEGDDMITARAESGTLKASSGQHFGQVIHHRNSVEYDLN